MFYPVAMSGAPIDEDDRIPVYVPFGERRIDPRPGWWYRDARSESLPGILLAWRRQKYADRRIYWEGLVLHGSSAHDGYQAQMTWVLGHQIRRFEDGPIGSGG
jgi:hypothetical protein